jgi:hypothetical protein
LAALTKVDRRGCERTWTNIMRKILTALSAFSFLVACGGQLSIGDLRMSNTDAGTVDAAQSCVPGDPQCPIVTDASVTDASAAQCAGDVAYSSFRCFGQEGCALGSIVDRSGAGLQCSVACLTPLCVGTTCLSASPRFACLTPQANGACPALYTVPDDHTGEVCPAGKVRCGLLECQPVGTPFVPPECDIHGAIDPCGPMGRGTCLSNAASGAGYCFFPGACDISATCAGATDGAVHVCGGLWRKADGPPPTAAPAPGSAVCASVPPACATGRMPTCACIMAQLNDPLAQCTRDSNGWPVIWRDPLE